MLGMDATTGRELSGRAHLEQSVRDILTTPVGSRVMRRDYGSRLLELVDAPRGRGTLLQIYAATAGALARWEPRISLSRVRAAATGAAGVVLEIEGEARDGAGPVRIAGLSL